MGEALGQNIESISPLLPRRQYIWNLVVLPFRQ